MLSFDLMHQHTPDADMSHFVWYGFAYMELCVSRSMNNNTLPVKRKFILNVLLVSLQEIYSVRCKL